MNDDTALVVANQDTGELPEPTDQPTTLTSQQSRVNAVNMVMLAAMNRASTLVLTPEESKALAADFPDEAFKYGAAGKEDLIYIEHPFLRDRFNEVFGLGRWTIIRTEPYKMEPYEVADKFKGGKKPAIRVYANCALLIRGCFVAEAVGDMSYFPDNATMNYGDAAEGAQTQAFRRCAKNFGVGIQAWKKDFCEEWKHRNPKVGYKTPPKAETKSETKSETEVVDARAKLDELLDLIGGYSLDKVKDHFTKVSAGRYIVKRDLKAAWVKEFGEDGYAELKARLIARSSVLSPKAEVKPKPESKPVEGLPTQQQVEDDTGLSDPNDVPVDVKVFCDGLPSFNTMGGSTEACRKFNLAHPELEQCWKDYVVDRVKEAQAKLKK